MIKLFSEAEWKWMATVTKCATLLLILFYGEPDLITAIIDLIGRLP
jgi:hypothetical protein